MDVGALLAAAMAAWKGSENREPGAVPTLRLCWRAQSSDIATMTGHQPVLTVLASTCTLEGHGHCLSPAAAASRTVWRSRGSPGD